jgi:hypothetical protein
MDTPEALCYTRLADHFKKHTQAIEIFKWPFFSQKLPLFSHFS